LVDLERSHGGAWPRCVGWMGLLFFLGADVAFTVSELRLLTIFSPYLHFVSIKQ
jgi:hypothetical protein